MTDWTTHPAMDSLDPMKRNLIRAAAEKVSGKSGNQMATVMMALITTARKRGVTFSPEEMTLILDILKDGKSPEEQAQIDQMVSMTMNMIKNYR